MTEPLLSELAPRLYRLQIPGGAAHLLNAYLWCGDDGVTLVDTGWPGSGDVIERALTALGRGKSDVVRVVLTHFHDDHAGAAAEVAAWGRVEVVAGAGDARFITGEQAGPLPVLTVAELAIHAQPTDPPHGPLVRVDREVRDGDVLDFAGGARVVAVPGHTPGSIALYLPAVDAILTGDAVAELQGEIILGVFNSNREAARSSLDAIVATTAQIAGFGHGDPILHDASRCIAHAQDPFA